MVEPACLSRFDRGVELPVVAYMAVIHIAALVLCLGFPSRQAVAAAIGLYLLTGFGVTIGYHRLLTHRSFDCSKPLETLLALLGLLAGEGPPLFWVMHHRKHHKFSDQPGDPHRPADGFFWAHWLWLFPKHRRRELGMDYVKWAPDLAKRPFYRGLEVGYLPCQAVFGVMIGLWGYALGSWSMALSFLGYAFFLRMVLVLHATWMVNSVAHTWGYRNYETNDNSRNNVFVAAVALGEGWHNNHHRIQQTANHGHTPWEFDVSFWVIVGLAALSQPLAWIGLKLYRPVSNLRVYAWKTQRVVKWFE
jgi:fatty-acid desaturase